MASIATFHRFEERDLAGLRTAAVPVRRWLRAPRDDYPDFVARHGREVAGTDSNGIAVLTLLTFLEERRGIDLMHSRHDELAKFLCEQRELTCFLLTDEHFKLGDALKSELFSADELRVYYEEFYETDEPEVGEALIATLAVLRTALAALQPQCAILLQIG